MDWWPRYDHQSVVIGIKSQTNLCLRPYHIENTDSRPNKSVIDRDWNL